MNGSGMADRRMRDLVSRELAPGETIIWYDRPVPRFFTILSTIAFLFGILLTVIFGALISATYGTPPFGIQNCPDCDSTDLMASVTFMSIYVLVLIFLLSAPLQNRKSYANTIYAVTDRRAIVISAWKNRYVKNVWPSSLSSLIREEKKGGTGDIYVAVGAATTDDPTQIGLFWDLREPRIVEALLRGLASGTLAAANNRE